MQEDGIARKGLVLSGGGAYGAYEVGVLKALAAGQMATAGRVPLDPEVLTGTSVGSFNAAVLTMLAGNAAEAVKRLEQIWLYEIADRGGAQGNGVYRIRGNPPGYLETMGKNPLEPLLKAAGDAAYLGGQWAMRATQFMTSKASLSNRALGLIDVSSFICVDPFTELLERTIDLEGIRRSRKMLRIVATNWETGEAKLFTNRDMTDDQGWKAILASASVPGVFPPVALGKNTYVDGGVVLNTPISAALDAGATELHVVYLNPDVREEPLRSGESTIDVFDRLLTASLSNRIDQDIAMAARINKALETLERVAAGVEPQRSESTNILRVFTKIYERVEADRPFSKITVHRYHPARGLGGPLALLNFSQAQIRSYIELGYNDARIHNCVRNGCLLPDRTHEVAAQRAGLKVKAVGSSAEEPAGAPGS